MIRFNVQSIRTMAVVGLFGALLFSVFSLGFGPSGGTVYAGDGKPPCGFGQNPDTHDCRIPEFEREDTRDPAMTNCTGSDCGLIDRYLNPIINFLAIIVGIVVAISIVAGGIQYSSSADDPQKVAQAKSRIINAVLALIAFLFLYAFLQWLVPGGFLN